jgi:hypothetical protein
LSHAIFVVDVEAARKKITFTVENSSRTKWATSAILKKMSKVNIHPMDENAPNQVTLITTRRR